MPDKKEAEKKEVEKAPPKVQAPATCKYCHTVTNDGTDACDDHKEPDGD